MPRAVTLFWTWRVGEANLPLSSRGGEAVGYPRDDGERKRDVKSLSPRHLAANPLDLPQADRQLEDTFSADPLDAERRFTSASA